MMGSGHQWAIDAAREKHNVWCKVGSHWGPEYVNFSATKGEASTPIDTGSENQNSYYHGRRKARNAMYQAPGGQVTN